MSWAFKDSVRLLEFSHDQKRTFGFEGVDDPVVWVSITLGEVVGQEPQSFKWCVATTEKKGFGAAIFDLS